MQPYDADLPSLSLKFKDVLRLEAKLLVVLTAMIFAAYYALFSYFHFGLVLFGEAYYVYYIVLSAGVLAVLAGISIALGLYANKSISTSKTKERKGIYAIIISVIPSTMCCTPVIPSIAVAFFGSGGIALASGALQGVLSIVSPLFIMFAALLMAYSIRTSFVRIKNNACKC